MSRQWAGRVGWVLPVVVAVVAVVTVLVVGLMVSTARADRPARPGDVEVEGGDREVAVSFEEAARTSEPQLYEVSLNDSQWLPLDAVPRDGRMTGLVDGLLDGTTYEVQVRVVGSAGTSPPSLSTAATRATTAGEAPRVEAEAADDDGDVVVTFAGYDHEGLDGWRVVARPEDPVLRTQQVVCETGSASCAVRGLDDEASYDLEATPFSSLLPGSMFLRTVDGAPIDLGRVTGGSRAAEAPLDLTAVPLDGALELGWRMPRRNDADSTAEFELAIGSEPDARWVRLDVTREGGRFSATVPGLDNGEPTRVSVRAAGESQPGAVATVEGAPAGPPTRVRGAEVTTRGTIATLRWRAPRDTGGADVRTYVVSGFGNPGCTTRRTTCSVRGIDPRRPVRFAISADNTTDGQPDTGLGPAVRVASAGPRR